MDIESQIKYWREGARGDLTVAEHLFLHGYYPWSLFIGHLVLEKMLKAVFVNRKATIPPKTHNLITLANLAEVALTGEQESFLFTANTFSLEARYPEYKDAFNRLCTPHFT